MQLTLPDDFASMAIHPALIDIGKNYARRDLSRLQEPRRYYDRHVNAMQEEGLSSSSDIAAELAFRDMLIDFLMERCVDIEELAGAVMRAQDLLDVCTAEENIGIPSAREEFTAAYKSVVAQLRVRLNLPSVEEVDQLIEDNLKAGLYSRSML